VTDRHQPLPIPRTHRIKKMGSRTGGSDAASAAAAHLTDVPESPDSTSPGLAAAGSAASSHRGIINAVTAAAMGRGSSSGGGVGSGDEAGGDAVGGAFFPELVELVAGLTERLEKILTAGESS